MGKSIQELGDLRKSLLSKISPNGLQWVNIQLTDGVSVKICKTVKIDGLYVPVTAKETWEVAKSFGVSPLTRAVCDQIFNQATFSPYRWQPELYDFEKHSGYLNTLNYDGVGTFGAH